MSTSKASASAMVSSKLRLVVKKENPMLVALNVFDRIVNDLADVDASQVATRVFDRMVGDLEFAGQVEELMAMAEEYELSLM